MTRDFRTDYHTTVSVPTYQDRTKYLYPRCTRLELLILRLKYILNNNPDTIFLLPISITGQSFSGSSHASICHRIVALFISNPSSTSIMSFSILKDEQRLVYICETDPFKERISSLCVSIRAASEQHQQEGSHHHLVMNHDPSPSSLTGTFGAPNRLR